MESAILERQPRCQDENARRLRSQDLVRPRDGHDSRGLVDSDAAHAGANLLHLANMEACPDLEAVSSRDGPDRAGTPERGSGADEGRQEPITGGLDLAPAEPFELCPRCFVGD